MSRAGDIFRDSVMTTTAVAGLVEGALSPYVAPPCVDLGETAPPGIVREVDADSTPAEIAACWQEEHTEDLIDTLADRKETELEQTADEIGDLLAAAEPEPVAALDVDPVAEGFSDFSGDIGSDGDFGGGDFGGPA